MRTKKGTPPATFGEQYEVSLDYQRPDGFWAHSHKHFVRVFIKHGVNEKNNHEAAKEIAQRDFPGCRINSVTYL